MKSILLNLMGILMLLSIASTAQADRNLVREMATNCKVELDTYCKDVTPGGGRILACLHAHSDKLSEACHETVAEVTEQAKAMGAAIHYVSDECADDLQQYCKDVPPGKGRIMNCLDQNDAKLSQRCQAALKDVGLRQ